MTKSIFEVSRAATRVVFAAQLATQIIAVLSLAILYRLLQPADFGLLGMAVPLVMLPRMLANSGIHAAAVQQSRLSSEQLSSLFWWNLSAGCVAAAMTAAGAVPLAAIYKVAELAEIGWWLAGTSILAAVVSQYQTRLERELRIGRVAVSRLAAMVAGCLTAVAAAQANFGVWALVMQMYAELFFLSVFLFAAGWWIPNWPWQGQSVRGFLRRAECRQGDSRRGHRFDANRSGVHRYVYAGVQPHDEAGLFRQRSAFLGHAADPFAGPFAHPGSRSHGR